MSNEKSKEHIGDGGASRLNTDMRVTEDTVWGHRKQEFRVEPAGVLGILT